MIKLFMQNLYKIQTQFSPRKNLIRKYDTNWNEVDELSVRYVPCFVFKVRVKR
jgi:hypothetical protein